MKIVYNKHCFVFFIFLLSMKLLFSQIPTVQIISPEDGDMFPNSEITAEGYAYDTSDYVVSVKVKMNGDPNNSSYWYTGYSDIGQHLMSPEWSRDIDLDPGLNNIYVKASDNYGNWSEIESNEFWYIAPPENVIASSGTYEDHIRVSWDIWEANPSYTNYYKIYRGVTSDPNEAIDLSVGYTPNRYWDDYDVESNIHYYYFIKVRSHLTESNFSDYGYGWTIPPPTPQNIIISTDLTNNLINLSWDDEGGMYSYEVYSSEDPYNGFQEDLSGIYSESSWLAPIPESKKFFYIKTTNSK